MIVSIHQPADLPWLGYLDRISRSDVFIYLDTVQFETNSFTNRNRIKTPDGSLWLTIPVRSKGHLDRSLLDIEIDGLHWRRKHLGSLRQSYAKAPFFSERFPRLDASYDRPAERLVEFCFGQLGFWLSEFDIGTPVLRASQLDVSGSKSQLVLSLCRAVGATTYLSGPLGRDYLDAAAFASAGIAIRDHDFSVSPYPQLHGSFVPNMGAVDYWLNVAEPRLPECGR